jgi:hypothetical protein
MRNLRVKMPKELIIISVKGGACAPRGFYADGLNSGLRKGERGDQTFIRSDIPCEGGGFYG